MREAPEHASIRWEMLREVQAHYSTFVPFMRDGMAELGFSATAIQEEIALWLEHGPQYLMVQAQRGQAKTTVAALFAVWCLIHSPAHRVLVISAGGTQANEISTLIVRVILSMEVLECLRPDKMAGDRTSVEAFDVHHSLKGLDKSPSVACVGIDSNLQGKRADLLIADDIESGKNSATAAQRAKLAHITKDFTSINSTGRIVWLGTPQTLESIYNSLPARGVAVRIWPGRYPDNKQRLHYGLNLAPSIVMALHKDPSLASGGGLLGDQGKPVDPQLLDEAALQKKELDQGSAYFQLQHMLNTTLSDALRFPLKPEKLVLLRSAGGQFPLTVVRGMTDECLHEFNICDLPYRIMRPHEVSRETSRLLSLWAYIDPAPGGENADETAWAIGGFLNGNIYLLSAGGMPGGYELEKLQALAKLMARFHVGPYKLDGVKIEKNMGHGAFRAVWTPVLREVIKDCQIEDDLVSGQKELRIVNTLSPIMGRGSLIVDEAVLEEDQACCDIYNASMRSSYSLFHQLQKMTIARKSVLHDDRADALEGLCRHYTEAIAKDQKKGLQAAQARAYAELVKDPCGHNRYTKTPSSSKYGSLLKRKRR